MGNTNHFGTVAIGIRATHPAAEFVGSVARLVASMEAGDRMLNPVCGYPHHIAAEILARDFLHGQCDSLLMVDDDMVVHERSLPRLRANADGAAYSVLSALACCGKPPHLPVVLEDRGDGLYQYRQPDRGVPSLGVGMVGLAFTLIRRTAFMAIDDGSWFFAWGPRGEGEDATFCRRLRSIGLKIGVAMDCDAGHVRDVTVRWDSVLKAPTYGYAQDERAVRLLRSEIERAQS